MFMSFQSITHRSISKHRCTYTVIHDVILCRINSFYVLLPLLVILPVLLTPGASFVKARFCKNALDHSHQLQEQSRSFSPFCSKRAVVENKMTPFRTEVYLCKNLKRTYSVLAAVLSNIYDHSDMNFIYVLSANKCQQQIRNNDRKNNLKKKHQTKSQSVYKHTSRVTKAAGK